MKEPLAILRSSLISKILYLQVGFCSWGKISFLTQWCWYSGGRWSTTRWSHQIWACCCRGSRRCASSWLWDCLQLFLQWISDPSEDPGLEYRWGHCRTFLQRRIFCSSRLLRCGPILSKKCCLSSCAPSTTGPPLCPFRSGESDRSSICRWGICTCCGSLLLWKTSCLSLQKNGTFSRMGGECSAWQGSITRTWLGNWRSRGHPCRWFPIPRGQPSRDRTVMRCGKYEPKEQVHYTSGLLRSTTWSSS